MKQWKAEKAGKIAQIIISTAQAVASQLTIPGAGFALAAIAGAAGAAQIAVAAAQQPPAFADGGVIYGPTMGLMGEYPTARTDPEIISPLSKLKSIIGDTGSVVYVTGEFRQKGTDLVAVIDQTRSRQNRY